MLQPRGSSMPPRKQIGMAMNKPQKDVIYTNLSPKKKRSISIDSSKSRKSATSQKKATHTNDVISAEVTLAQETFGE